MDYSERFYLRWTRIVLRYLHSTQRIPHFDAHEIQQKASTRRTQADELNYLTELSRASYLVFFLITAYATFTCKNMTFLVTWFWVFNQLQPENNLEHLEGNIHKFACIHTNCSGVLAGESNLARGLSSLPIYEICNPNLSRIYPPAISIGNYGVFMFALSIFANSLFGIGLPIFNIAHPAKFETVLMVLAPHDTIQMTCDKISRKVQLFKLSFENFCSLTRQSRWARRFHLRTILNEGYHSKAEHQEDRLHYELDCLPIVRSFWWRDSIARLFAFSTWAVWVALAMLTAIVMISISVGMDKRTAFLLLYADEIKRQPCAIWTKSDLSGEPHMLDLVDISMRYIFWDPYSLIESLVMLLSLATTMLWMICFLYLNVLEANCWLAEIKYQVLLASDILELIGRRKAERSYRQNNFDMSSVRCAFIANSSLIHMAVLINHRLASSDLKPKLERQKFASQLIGLHSYDRSSTIDLLSKTYINLCLFVDFIDFLKPLAKVLVLAVYGINYGLLITSLCFSERVRDFMVTAQVSCLIAWMFTNVPLLLVSNFHSRTRRLLPALWTLLSKMDADTDDINIAHLRLVWSRMVESIDDHKGIQFQAFGVSVNYGNTIRIMIALATVMLIAAKS